MTQSNYSPDAIAAAGVIRALELLGVKSTAKLFLNWLTRLRIPQVVPTKVRVIPHDRDAFTQGLAYHQGLLYESTGGHENSSLRCIDPQNGDILRLVPVPNDFAEGIALFDGRILQLSWQSGKARIYTLPDLTQVGMATYAGEGWGLTAADGMLVMSDGSSALKFVDDRISVHRTLRVQSHGIPIRNINDIEFAAGSLYANVYGSNDILEISLRTGRVGRILKCDDLATAAPPGNPAAIMNGIAFDAANNTFYVTGKHWSSIFEIRVPMPTGGF